MLALLKLLPVVIALAMAWGLWNKVQALAVLETEFDKQQDTIATLQEANDTTVASLSECARVNEINDELTDAAVVRAIEAERQVRVFTELIEADIEDIKANENELRVASRTNETCYKLDDRLPDFLFD